MDKKILTFDIGGMGIKVIKFNSTGEIVLEDYLTHDHLIVNEFFVKLKDLLNLINDYVKKNNESVDVGICIPGIVDKNLWEVKSRSFVIEWKDFNIKEFFDSNPLIKNLAIENDAKSAAFGEFMHSNKNMNQNFKNGVVVTIGSAIGGGIIIDQKVYSGTNGLAGEFSKMYSNLGYDDKNEAAGECSTMSMRIKFAQALKKELKDISGITIMDEYKKNNKLATEIVDNATTALAKLIFNIIICIDCEVVLIGGGISANKVFIDLVKTKLKKYYKEQELIELYPQKISSCDLENKAGCYGMFYKLKEFKMR